MRSIVTKNVKQDMRKVVCARCVDVNLAPEIDRCQFTKRYLPSQSRNEHDRAEKKERDHSLREYKT